MKNSDQKAKPRMVVFGAGYVGAALVRQASARGMAVTALTRNPEKAAHFETVGAQVVIGELSSDEWHGRVAGEPDYVVNCVSSGGAGLAGYQRSYVEGMRSILRWAEKQGAPRAMVYTSSTSVYPQSGGEWVDEEASTEGAGEYPAILLEAEGVLRAGRSVPRWTILRLAGIYGPGRHHVLDTIRSGAQSLAGAPTHVLNLIHRDDIVAALWAALERDGGGEIFNVADDEPVRRGELVEWLATRLSVPVPAFDETASGLRRRSALDRRIDNRKIKRVLGWKPAMRSFREGYEAILGAL